MEKIKRTFGFIMKHPLAKKHLFKSVFRLVFWQVQSTIFKGSLIIKPFIRPIQFYAQKGLTGITGNIYAGLHEFNDMTFLLHFLEPGDTFFDVGANVGAYTLLASGVCKSKTIALEPAHSTFDLLTKNIALNKLHDRVILLNSAAGAIRGEVLFTDDQDTTNHVVAADEAFGSSLSKVSVLTIDSLTKDNSPALMKIDVEGFETEVLNGMTETLKNGGLKAIIIELNGSGERYGYSEDAIHKLLLTYGFSPYSYDPFKRVLEGVYSYGNENTIYCRDIDFILNRLMQSPQVKIMGELI